MGEKSIFSVNFDCEKPLRGGFENPEKSRALLDAHFDPTFLFWDIPLCSRPHLTPKCQAGLVPINKGLFEPYLKSLEKMLQKSEQNYCCYGLCKVKDNVKAFVSWQIYWPTGSVVKVLTLHQCDLGLITGCEKIYGLMVVGWGNGAWVLKVLQFLTAEATETSTICTNKTGFW